MQMKKYEWHDDLTNGTNRHFVSDVRFSMLEGWGLTPEALSFFCKQIFKYKQYVTDIILSKDERDLFETRNESWHLMRQIMEPDGMSARRRERNCYAAAKDILVDGMFTDIILLHIHYFFPDLNIRKNKQDEALELKQQASIEPDFVINDKCYLEMKITRDSTDELNRSLWTNKTLTIRPARLESELLRYKGFKHLYFLRINYTSQLLAVIKYADFRPSITGDGSYYAKYDVKKFGNADFEGFIKLIRNAILNKIGV